MGCIRDKPLKQYCGQGPEDGVSSATATATAENDVNNTKNGPQNKVANFSNVVVDDRLPLSVRQCFRLIQSWRAIKRNISETGVEMFIRLFKSNSELKNMFHEFKDLTSEDDLRANEALENHATLVMTTLDDAITHIDNYDYVSEVLRKTGASHVRFEGFKSDNFLNIRDPFLEAVKITLGDRYTDNMESIYKVAITFILQTMVEGMEDALKNKAT
ncbi:neuroglobin-like isoform X2 [Littorina saxatilis]|uniref:neuroglobin-like isoform X2 n=1 Tax=Littorina saxatilis TaxID=31220 RepID=UPI0038B53AB1